MVAVAVLISDKHPSVTFFTIAVRSEEAQAGTAHIPCAQLSTTETMLAEGSRARLTKDPALRHAACGEMRTFPRASEQDFETLGMVIEVAETRAAPRVATKVSLENMIKGGGLVLKIKAEKKQQRLVATLEWKGWF